MNKSKIATRYSKALFELAKENNILNKVKNDIDIVINAYNTYSEVSSFLNSPIIKMSNKKILFSKLFAGKISQTTDSFIKLLIDNKRENQLLDIARVFIDRYKKEKGIKTATITTATKITDELKSKISKLVSEVEDTNVEFYEIENKDIIGGFILRIDDNQFDASIASKLESIKKRLLTTTIK